HARLRAARQFRALAWRPLVRERGLPRESPRLERQLARDRAPWALPPAYVTLRGARRSNTLVVVCDARARQRRDAEERGPREGAGQLFPPEIAGLALPPRARRHGVAALGVLATSRHGALPACTTAAYATQRIIAPGAEGHKGQGRERAAARHSVRGRRGRGTGRAPRWG